MEIHVQQCQKCFSRDVRNILVREDVDSVFVQCTKCEALVARYILRREGYFHVGKGYESFLRSHERDGMSLDNRNLADEYTKTEQEVHSQFKTLNEKIRKKYQ